MCSVTEKPTTDNPQPPLSRAVRVHDWARLGPRRRKEVMLPQVTQLALEGHCGEAISRKLGLPKRTVNHWLEKLRQEWLATAVEGAAEMMALTLARLDAIYREAMQAWRDSQNTIEVRLVEDTEVAGGEPKRKTSTRTQPPRRNAALLTRATAAALARGRLIKGKAAPWCAEADSLDAEPTASETPMVNGLQIPKPGTIAADRWWLDMCGDDLPEMELDEIYEAKCRLRRVIESEGGAFPAELEGQDLLDMSLDEVQAHRVRLKAAIDAFFADEEEEESPPSSCETAAEPEEK